MTTAALVVAGGQSTAVDADALLSALPGPVIALDAGDRFRFANPAAEQFFGAGAGWLRRHALADVVAGDSLLVALVRQARSHGLRAAGGIGMLVQQGALAFARWTGCQPPLEAMRTSARNVLHA